MIRLEFSEALGRKIRCEHWDNIGISTYTKLKEALQQRKISEGLELVDYLHTEFKFIHDTFADWTYSLLDFVAKKYGEDELYNALRENFELLARAQNALAKPFSSIEEALQFDIENMRAHRCGKREIGDVTVREERDRYVVSMDPCGSGGRMRRIGEIDGSPPRTDSPYNLGVTKKPHFWSWNRAGVPYYCVKCCVWYEVIPIERRGYPTKISDFPDDPNMPCIRYYYKSPELIPEEFFLRVGMKKELSRFVR